MPKPPSKHLEELSKEVGEDIYVWYISDEESEIVEWPHHSPVTPAQAGVSRGRVHKMPACAGMTVLGMGRSAPAPFVPSAVEARGGPPFAPNRHPELVSGSMGRPSPQTPRRRRGGAVDAETSSA